MRNLIILTACLLLPFCLWAEEKSSSTSVYVSWNTHSIGGTVPCPDQTKVDPYNSNHSIINKDAKRNCHDDIVEKMNRIFSNRKEAEEFKNNCPLKQCSDWVMRDAVKDDYINDVFNKNHWTIEEYAEGLWHVTCSIDQATIVAGTDQDQTLNAAMIFAEKNWKLMILNANTHNGLWGVIPNDKAIRMMDGELVNTRENVTVDPIATGKDAEDATMAGLEAAGVKQRQKGSKLFNSINKMKTILGN